MSVRARSQMHLGSVATIGQLGAHSLSNFKHVVLNNFCHDSVGGQPSAGACLDFAAAAKASGYRCVDVCAGNIDQAAAKLAALAAAEGPALLEVKLSTGTRGELGRPTTTTHKTKAAFMEYLQQPPPADADGMAMPKFKLKVPGSAIM